MVNGDAQCQDFVAQRRILSAWVRVSFGTPDLVLDMAENYRVCIIMPKGYAHSSAFIEIAHLLVSSLTSLGLSCDIKLNDLAPDRINVLLGFHLLNYNDGLRQYRYIPYQLEQLSEKEGAYSENVRLLLSHATEVWDYSLENIAFLGSRGIRAKHLPVGYHQDLDRIPDSADREFDVLFYGSIGGRRKPVLDRICANPRLKVKLLFGAYGRQRDEYIARSKIVLNVHYYETKIFEAVRISYLLNNRCFVLSEESAANPYAEVDIPLVPYGDLEKMCEYYVQHAEERNLMRLKAHGQFSGGYPMVELVRQVVLA
jgi:hypothetical protein